MPTYHRRAFCALVSMAVLIAACESPRTAEAPATNSRLSAEPPATDSPRTGEPPATEALIDTIGEHDADDWQVLFDGEHLEGWRGFRQQDVPESWAVSDDGAIHFARSDGDINDGLITKDAFSDFELRFEWRVASGGNSGVFFHVTEEEDAIWKTGPEYQIVDNTGHPDGAISVTSAGSNYGLHGPDMNFSNPPDTYNEGRILVRDGQVEHYLNGQRVVQYEIGSDEWDALVAESSFSEYPAYGNAGSGHIALQEGGPVWYRDIRIRRLDFEE